MKLLGACNPLLDVVADVPSSLLDEYDLPHGGAVLANEKQLKLFPKLEKEFKCKYLPGGCGQNTIRVFQALSQKPGTTKFLGCIGRDKEGEQLRELLISQGIKPIYKVSETKHTGTCMVLVTDKERCVCTHLGASVDIDEDFLQQHWAEVEECTAVYCTAFLLSSSSQVLLRLSQHCAETGKIFCCNLSAEFLMKEYKKEYLEMLKNANIACGNKDEALQFASVHSLDSTGSLGDVAAQILDIMLTKETDKDKDNDKNNDKEEDKDKEKEENTQKYKELKIAVITQGEDPVVVACRMPCGSISIMSFPVPALTPEKIIDLNGAGDAFIGGFLFGVLQKNKEINMQSIEESVKIANWCSSVVIQQSGFQFTAEGCPYI